MKVVVSHPTGNRNVRAVVAAFHRAGMLGAFHSSLAITREARWPRWLPGAVGRELGRRVYDLPGSALHAHPAREVVRLLASRAGVRRLVEHERGWACVDRVYRDVDRAVAGALGRNALPDAVYAYEDGAEATFRQAAHRGVRRVYDLPIAYWETLRTLLAEEGERLPAWAGTLGGGLGDSAEKRDRKTRELELAELVAVPSEFVKKSLPAWAGQKRVVVTPFGSPDPLSDEVATEAERRRMERQASGRPLRILFAGSMSQRKGLGDLMTAVRALSRKDVELVVMGSLQAERGFYARECPGFVHEPGRPHEQVLELMRSCDVFCLPSIVEGRALVLQEAMSQGLPVIITPNTGGEDLVRGSPLAEPRSSGDADRGSGNQFFGLSTGFLVPIRSPERIAEAIEWCADHRSEIVEMGRAARHKAAGYTWDSYAARVVGAVRALVEEECRRLAGV